MSEWSPVQISAWGHRRWRKSAVKSKWKTEPLPLAPPGPQGDRTKIREGAGSQAEPKEPFKSHGVFRAEGLKRSVHPLPTPHVTGRTVKLSTPTQGHPAQRCKQTRLLASKFSDLPLMAFKVKVAARVWGAGHSPAVATDQEPHNIIYGASVK